MSLKIRIDDFLGTKREEAYRHNLDNFVLFDYVLRDRGLCYVLGVIPSSLGEDEIDWLSQQKHITVAMHGIVHDESRHNEFEGMRFSEIENIISPKKIMMEMFFCKNIIDYIPPHNVFDEDTVIALKRCGFKNIYGGPGSDDTSIEFARRYLDYRHSEFPKEYGRSDELIERGSIEHIWNERSKKDVWLTLHWTWEFNIGLDNMRRYLDRLLLP